MKQKKALKIIGGILFIIAASASITSRKLPEPFVHRPPLGGAADILAQYENPRPKWKKIIEEAFGSLGVTGELQWMETQDWYYSAFSRDYILEDHNLSLTISTRLSADVWDCDTCPSRDYIVDVKEINFHSQKALFLTVSREPPYGLQHYEIEWKMDGLYYSVVFTAQSIFEGTPEPAYTGADALYYAAGGTGGSSSPPEAESPPANLCAGKNCKNNYCTEDGSKFLYDCSCDPDDGDCKCRGDVCTSGCDAAQGGCIVASADPCEDIPRPTNFCTEDNSQYMHDCHCEEGEYLCRTDECAAGCDVAQGGCLPDQSAEECPADFCEEDQKTRVYNCKPDEADGQCGCLVEVCTAGCNIATGKCVESMVIPDDSGGGDDDYIDYDNSPDPLGLIGGIAAGGGLLAGGGYLAYKGIQAAIARRALSGGAKAASKAAADAAEPSLSELLARAERSADRASRSLEIAQEAARSDQQAYKDFVRRRTHYDEKWAKTMGKRAQMIERMETGVKTIKKGADAAADLVGNVPGVGTKFKYGYHIVTAGVETAAGGGTVGEVVLSSTRKGIETYAGDRLFGDITLMGNVQKDTTLKTVKQFINKAGVKDLALETVKNYRCNQIMNASNKIRGKSFIGDIDKGLNNIAKKVDSKSIKKFVADSTKKMLYIK